MSPATRPGPARNDRDAGRNRRDPAGRRLCRRTDRRKQPAAAFRQIQCGKSGPAAGFRRTAERRRASRLELYDARSLLPEKDHDSVPGGRPALLLDGCEHAQFGFQRFPQCDSLRKRLLQLQLAFAARLRPPSEQRFRRYRRQCPECGGDSLRDPISGFDRGERDNASFAMRNAFQAWFGVRITGEMLSNIPSNQVYMPHIPYSESQP